MCPEFTGLLIWLLAFIHVTTAFTPALYELATIHFSHLISSDPSIRKIEEDKMLHAMENIGFMVITDHGIDKRILDDMWNVTQAFFNSSYENKHAIMQDDNYMYGYEDDEALGYTEKIEYYDKTNEYYTVGVDKKEMFQAYIGSVDNPQRLKDVRWPPKPVEMKDVWVKYYRACEQIARQLLKSMAIALELEDPHYFDAFINDHMSAIRALNYPAIDLEEALSEKYVNTWRCSAHSDYGTFTLLRQDGVGGLQVEINEHEWVDVTSDKYDFIVNLGNTMKQWTNDRFKSTRHRVVKPRNVHETARRQSIAFFHNPNGNALIQTLPSCTFSNGTVKYEPILFLDLLTQLVGSRKGQIADDAKDEL
eukprot:65792_1